MKIALLWWPLGSAPGGVTQAIRGNTFAFEANGHDIDLFQGSRCAELVDRVDEYDVVFSPFLYADEYPLDLTVFRDVHFHLQIGGFGNLEKDPDLFAEVLERVDTISTLGLRPILYFSERVDVDAGEISFIPNAPNFDLFTASSLPDENGYVFEPKIGSPHKTGETLCRVATTVPDVTFETHVKTVETVYENCAFRLPENLFMKPPVPLTGMDDRYDGAKLVLNTSSRDCFPNTALEAMLCQRPYVCTMDSIAYIMTVPDIDVDDFGKSAATIYETYRTDFFQGDHVATVEQREIMGNVVRYLLQNESVLQDLANRGQQWIHRNLEGWTWKAKGERIIDQIEGAT